MEHKGEAKLVRERVNVLGVGVDPVSVVELHARILAWRYSTSSGWMVSIQEK